MLFRSGAKCGFISVLIYLLIGSIGLPVFAGFSGGLGVLLGPTGGFLIGFPLIALVPGYIKEKSNSNVALTIALILGLFLDYVVGTLYFANLTGSTIKDSLLMCVAPFIVIDFIKLALAYIVGIAVSKRLPSSMTLANS